MSVWWEGLGWIVWEDTSVEKEMAAELMIPW